MTQTPPQRAKSEKRLKAEALFRAQYDAQGFVSQTEVARAVDADVSNTGRWMRAWYRENNINRPKVTRGGRTKAPYVRRIQNESGETQLAAPAGASAPGDRLLVGSADAKSRPFDVFERLDAEKLPMVPTFLPREGATKRELQDSAFMRALYLQMTDQDAAAVAAMSRDELDQRLADPAFADMARTARAMGQFVSLKTLSNFIHAFPTSSKALDLASWLLERRASAFVRKTATAVAIAQDVHVRTSKDENPDSLVESIEAIQRRIAARGFGIAALPAADVIDADAVEGEEGLSDG